MFNFSSDEKTMDQGQGNVATNDAIAEAFIAAKGSRKRQSKSKTESDSGPVISSALLEQTKRLFTPEAWKPIVNMPFNMARALSGSDTWALEKTEEETLANTTSMTAEYFLQVDPKWVALILFSVNWSAIISLKTAKYLDEQKRNEAYIKSQTEGLK